MEAGTLKKVMWNDGAKAGLGIGFIAIAYMLLTTMVGKLNAGGSTAVAMLVSGIDVLLWAGKFVGCIVLLKFLMKRFAAANEGVSNKDTFRFGVVSVLFSSLLYAGFYLAFVLFIAPDLLTESFDMVIQSYSSMMDANARESLAQMQASLPEMTFFTNLVYSFIYGVILSAILSRNIPSRNPFE